MGYVVTESGAEFLRSGRGYGTGVGGGSVVVQNPNCPSGDVAANSDGSCPAGYQPDPNSPGCCKPIPPANNPAIPTATNPQSWTYLFQTWSTSLSDLTSHTTSFTQVLPLTHNCNNSTGVCTDVSVTNFGISGATIVSDLKAQGFLVQAVCQGGAGNAGTDAGIIAIITDSPSGTQQNFITQMIGYCQSAGYVGFNLDWEPGSTLQPTSGKSAYTNALTSFLQNAATQMHNAGFILTIECADWFAIGAYGGGNQNAWMNLADCAATPVDFLCCMNYDGVSTYSSFLSQFNFMISQIPAAKLIMMGISESSQTSAFAQQAMELPMNNSVPGWGLWPTNFWDATGVVPSGSTWWSLCHSFQSKTYPPT